MRLARLGKPPANKGKPCPEHVKEAVRRRNIGNTYRLGKKHNEDARRKIRARRALQTFSPETRRKLSFAGKGRKPVLVPWTSERRRIASERQRGAKSKWWRGGRTALSTNIRHCSKYTEWRLSVFERDRFTCVECGFDKGRIIEADHIIPFAVLLKENDIKTVVQALECSALWKIENGRTLCKRCHRKTATYLNKWWRRSQQISNYGPMTKGA